MRILLASAFLLLFVALALAVLVGLRARLLPPAEQTPLVYEEPSYPLPQKKAYGYQEVEQLLVRQLLNGPDSQGWRRLPDDNGVAVRRIFGTFPSKLLLAELTTQIEETSSQAELASNRELGTVQLFWQGQPMLELRYPEPQQQAEASRQAKIAIIMDDMGSSMQAIKQLLELDLLITPAILPGTPLAHSAVELLRARQREYMVHIPMEPRSYPDVNPGGNALLLGQSEQHTRQLVRSYLQDIPGSVGVNNHMGSRYTEETAAMRIVLDELKKHDQFFIDSRTIGSSVAFSEARKLRLKTATRNIFLDNHADVEYIRAQLRKMVALAGQNQEVIAICHPHRQTLEALRLEQNWLRRQDVEFVVASRVVHVY